MVASGAQLPTTKSSLMPGISTGSVTAEGMAGYQTVASSAWVFAPRQSYDLSDGVNFLNAPPTLNSGAKPTCGLTGCDEDGGMAYRSRQLNRTRRYAFDMSASFHDFSPG